MKRRTDYIVLIVGLLLMAFAVPSWAQEKSYPIIEEVSDSEQDRYVDESPDNETASRDSVALRPALPKSKEKSDKQANEGEDALSFNFLYYIIQRFKMSDIMEE
jgi:hypothetical protein